MPIKIINNKSIIKKLTSLAIAFCVIITCAFSALSVSAEMAGGISMRYYSNGAWRNFENCQAIANDISGIWLQTNGKDYRLEYRVQNTGKDDFYPAVSSNDTSSSAFAGLDTSTRTVMRAAIKVFDLAGNSVNQGIVVIYRSQIDGVWQPWVSNANPDWMRSIKLKYRLEGEINTSAANTSSTGTLKSISGLEIRVYEESSVTTQMSPSGNYKIINTPNIYQTINYPTGCESVSSVMALNYAGVGISVDSFIDNYLDKGNSDSFDPNTTFGGDPRSNSGMGCYSPVIKNACDKLLANTEYYATALKDVSILNLCTLYIDNNIPVIFWATTNMATPYISKSINYNGRLINWISPEHCLLLVGYDDYYYIFNDPQKTEYPVYYLKSDVERAYTGLLSQAVVIQKQDSMICPDTLPEFTPCEMSEESGIQSAFYGAVDLFKGSLTEKLNLASLTGSTEFTLDISYDSAYLAPSNFGCGFSSKYLKTLTVLSEKEIRIYETPSEYISYSLAGEGLYVSPNTAALGNVLKGDADGWILTRTNGSSERYDLLGRLYEITDDRGRCVQIEQNTSEILITDSLSGKTLYLMFSDGLITSVTDGTYIISELEYNNGYLVCIKGQKQFRYDQSGRLYKILNAIDETVCEASYNSISRVQSLKEKTMFTYSKNTVTVTENENVFTRIFDDRGNLIVCFGDGEETVSYGYNRNRNIISIVYGGAGDMNLDGFVDIRDFVRLKTVLANNINNYSNLNFCDINSNGTIAGTDLVLLEQFILGTDNRYISNERYTYDSLGRKTSFINIAGNTVYFSY